MTVVIRPAPGVFRRTMPLVVTFGLFRRFQEDPPLDETDVATLSRVVSLARKFHIPLAHSRILDDAKSPAPGVWLPGCRPKVTDRLFEHGPGSIFQNREFANVFGGITQRQIFFAGPRHDSSLTASATDLLAGFRSVTTIRPDGMLQLCSATAKDALPPHSRPDAAADMNSIELSEWERMTFQTEYV